METIKKVTPNKMEYKDRNYFLVSGKNPLTYTIPSRHSRRYPLLWFDEGLGHQRELRYASNQRSPFVDEQKGEVTLAHVVFRDGLLQVPKEKRNLQLFLAHHPHKGVLFQEYDVQAVAQDDYEDLEMEIEAMNLAYELEVDKIEAILRTELGSEVNKLSTKELKRDILIFAKRNPDLFLDLVDDENVELRNFGIKAREQGIIKLDSENRTFSWGSNGKKLMMVPFEENPYSALASWFQTDEGLAVYKSIDKKLK